MILDDLYVEEIELLQKLDLIRSEKEEHYGEELIVEGDVVGYLRESLRTLMSLQSLRKLPNTQEIDTLVKKWLLKD